MRYTIAGKENEKIVMLLPGTCCTAKFNFEKVVPLLAEKYKVICVDYDGFDGNEGDFTTMTDICRKIESYIIKRCGGEVFAAYGSSLGGSFVGLLVQRGKCISVTLLLAAPTSIKAGSCPRNCRRLSSARCFTEWCRRALCRSGRRI